MRKSTFPVKQLVFVALVVSPLACTGSSQAPPARQDASPAAAATPTPDAGPATAASAAQDASSDPDVEAAKTAALAWLALVDAGKFDATWDEAATSFHKAQKKDAWAKGLGEARPTMGKLVSRTFLNSQIRTDLPNLPRDKYITIRFTSSFEKNEAGAESVTLVKDGARGFRMMSYYLK